MVKPNQNVITKEHVANLPCHTKIPVAKTASSITKCQCDPRLIKIFTKLVRITNMNHKSSAKISYKVLKKLASDDYMASVLGPLIQDSTTSAPLPPLTSPSNITVFLDLDETLIHSVRASGLGPPPRNYNFIVGGEGDVRYVLKRPFVDEFLWFLSQSGFEIVLFTAGSEEYASMVLDVLDPDGLISHRLYRNSCKKFSRSFVKDLWNLGRDLTKVVIVDDKPYSYILQPENAIPIIPFTDDLGDDELKKLMSGFFTRCHEFEDLRDAVKHYVGNGVAYSNCIEKLSEDMWG
ncbi:putative protein-serine/threonine phosphatase [Helianthus annuus]|uniref:Putative FCP1-like domain, HAD-like domain protein n=1 Tax=Helianthus annuus TaxID=4232 RepID=A0A251S1H1_HELAN|nr:carboxy-terminal domain RNA polymerase II polypeptide A small phosphatase 2 [Helianthus annuus]KAF5760879.1 putative protein-serine/threonine phosphatase [Helianthus annuus]KAJ0438831.1 putative protein-serine/threonine phosphatase [Helianthus annuus]KAJ0443739.1 putative protein-serine/threonine phosphatase [Helianthus annuus]KAJ0461182.1 putative protein-serine/threonine phosphatase [Helianthus annuus]KAJ0641609.1 putative protein-serine/threonine phosphatase [Helianthus annuus]